MRFTTLSCPLETNQIEAKPTFQVLNAIVPHFWIETSPLWSPENSGSHNMTGTICIFFNLHHLRSDTSTANIWVCKQIICLCSMVIVFYVYITYATYIIVHIITLTRFPLGELWFAPYQESNRPNYKATRIPRPGGLWRA